MDGPSRLHREVHGIICRLDSTHSSCIVVTDHGDILVDKSNFLNPAGVSEGQVVACTVRHTPDGPKAVNVVLISGPDDGDGQEEEVSDSNGEDENDGAACGALPNPIIYHSLKGIVERLSEDGRSGRVITDLGDFLFEADLGVGDAVSVRDGQLVTCNVCQTAEGPQAIDIVPVSPPGDSAASQDGSEVLTVAEEFHHVHDRRSSDWATPLVHSVWRIVENSFAVFLQLCNALLLVIEMMRVRAVVNVRHCLLWFLRLLLHAFRSFRWSVWIFVDVLVETRSRIYMGNQRSVRSAATPSEDVNALLSEIATARTNSRPATKIFDTSRFEGPVPEELICSICCGVLNEPVLTACDHLFCRGCIARWLVEQAVCPMDRQSMRIPEDVRSAPHFVKSMLDSLRLRCDFAGRGCDSVLSLGEVESHEQRCRHR